MDLPTIFACLGAGAFLFGSGIVTLELIHRRRRANDTPTTPDDQPTAPNAALPLRLRKPPSDPPVIIPINRGP